MTEHIKVSRDGAVLEIIFARPDKKNALSNAMYRAATEAIDRAARRRHPCRALRFAGGRIHGQK
jgi:enoyl-CoA hydratase/carnithine racemase